MFEGYNPYLAALSVAVATLGGSASFRLAARIRATPGCNLRALLIGAAACLAIGIWAMNFIGMLAAPIPAVAYLILPTTVAFLICALAVFVSLFIVSIGAPSNGRIAAAALLLGAGIVTTHHVALHGLAGNFHIVNDRGMVFLSSLIAVAAAYGGLRLFLARHGGLRLALGAVVFGLAVSAMHYAAMYGIRVDAGPKVAAARGGLIAAVQLLTLIVALLCFLIGAGFLLFLVPEARLRAGQGLVSTPPMRSPVEGAEPPPFVDPVDA